MSIDKVLPPTPVPSTEHANVLLELALLMTAADGRLDDQEKKAYRAIVERVRGAKVSDATFEELLAHFSDHAGAEKIEQRVRAIGPKLPPELREPAFKLAMGLALVDKEGSDEEDDLMTVFVEALGLNMDRARTVAEEVRQAFGLE
jgi:tellurite resistance protein